MSLPKIIKSLTSHPFFWFSLILIPYLIINGPSIHNSFFQDDFLILRMSQTQNPFSFFLPLEHFPYRPFGTQGFYYINQALLGFNYYSYHYLTLTWLAINSFLVYLIAQQVLKSRPAGILAAFFYMLSSTHYMTLYWIATFYFAQGTTFFLLSFYLFLRYISNHNRRWLTYSLISYLVALLTNEATLFLPAIIGTFILLYQPKKNWKQYIIDLVPFGIIGTLLLVFRLTLAGVPDEHDYQIVVGIQTILTSKWYLLRSLNLPEGIRFIANSTQIYALLITFLATTFLTPLAILSIPRSFISQIKLSLRQMVRPIILGLSWFIFGAFFFFLLPNHMSIYYLEMSLAGIALIFAAWLKPILKLPLSSTKDIDIYSVLVCATLAVVIGSYAYLSLLSTQAMQQTHWVNRRASIAGNLTPQINAQCQQARATNQITITTSPEHLEEAKISLSFQDAAQALCKNHNISTIFQTSN